MPRRTRARPAPELCFDRETQVLGCHGRELARVRADGAGTERIVVHRTTEYQIVHEGPRGWRFSLMADAGNAPTWRFAPGKLRRGGTLLGLGQKLRLQPAPFVAGFWRLKGNPNATIRRVEALGTPGSAWRQLDIHIASSPATSVELLAMLTFACWLVGEYEAVRTPTPVGL
jgi:hypothetical protein